MKRSILAAACLCSLLASPALGTGIFEATFIKPVCFGRLYDAAHLRQHPRQTVSGITLHYTPNSTDDDRNTAAHFRLGFGFVLKRGGNWYAGSAYCKTAKAWFDCSLEGDGGLFRVTPEGKGLRFAVINRGGTDAGQDQINLEGDDFAGFGKPGGDDLVFVLPAASDDVCNPDGGDD